MSALEKPADYVVVRKMLEAGLSPDPQRVGDVNQPLRSLLPAA